MNQYEKKVAKFILGSKVPPFLGSQSEIVSVISSLCLLIFESINKHFFWNKKHCPLLLNKLELKRSNWKWSLRLNA